DLASSVLRPAERRMGVRRFAHLGIGIGESEAAEIEAPDVKPGGAERIAPGVAVEAMRYRQCGRKCRAMHIKYDARGVGRFRPLRREMAQEERHAPARARDPEMLFSGIEFFGHRWPPRLRQIGRASC